MEIQRLRPAGLSSAGYCAQAVRAGDTVYISGQIAVDADDKVVGAGDADVQAARVFESLGLAVEAAGGEIGDLVKITAYLTRPEYFGAIARGRERYLPERDGSRPAASTTVTVPVLVEPWALLQIDAIAVVGDTAQSHRAIDPDKLSKTPGHPHGAIAGNVVYATGVMARRYGQILGKGDAAIQARLAFDQMAYVLESVGASLADVVKHTTYFSHPSYFKSLSGVEGEVYGSARPSGTSVSITSMGSGPDPVVEIDAIAVIGGAVRRIPWSGSANSSPYSNVVIANDLVYISGQTATNERDEIVGAGDIDAQVEQVFANMDAALTAAGCDRTRMARTTIYVTHPAHAILAQRAHQDFFGDHAPASTTLVVQGLPDPRCLVEIEGIAVVE